jgi:hypothetical protein
MNYGQFISLPFLALFLVLAPTVLASTTWYVNGVNGSDSNRCIAPQTACKTIGHAISLAASGDSILVEAATYAENLTIGSSLTVTGSGASATIIDGQAAGTVVTIPNSSAQVTLSNITIRNGALTLSGGGINNAGTLTINDSTVSGNLAVISRRGQPGYGGGILNSGRVTINNSTISGNRAWCFNYCAGYGGGIFNNGSLTINNSTLNGNVAGGSFSIAHGGGIYNNTTGRVTINNSTISGNSTSAVGQGGGIYNNGGATINNTTISGNTASYRGRGDNIYNVSTAVLQNSIVASSTNGNCYGSVTSNGYNLSSDGTCSLDNTGDLNNSDPRLGPLQNNGGPAQTMALPSGSPAIDAGNPSGCTDGQGHLLKTDQRGAPRPDTEDTGGCDMGAYESQSD